ncbi:MAG: xanthine dehydrogenase family protein molybdopterin-binding subunit [Anaerolineales bacterium]
MAKYVGESIKRREDPRFIQGQGRYVANLNLPNMAHLAILRSPHGHANIKRIDVSKAAAHPGVIAVYTGKDLADGGVGSLPCGWTPPDIKVPAHMPLAVDRVRHVGDGVAAVAAESAYIARDALDLIEVEYEPLPVVVDAKAATEPGAPLVHDEIENNISYVWGFGNKDATEAAFANSDNRVIELDLINQRLIPNAMEPRAAVAQWNSFSEDMTLWTTSQNPHVIRLLLSAFTLFIPENKLRVISPDVGGGFGSKIFHYPEEVIVPWVARAIDRPVKWVATRSESYVTDAHGRDHVTTCKLAVDSDGVIQGIHVKTWANMGAYLSTFAPLIPTALYITLLSGLYNVPEAIWGEMVGTVTNTVPVDAYRGAGRPEASYLLERLVELAAKELDMDPIAFRRKNFITEFPHQTPVAFLYDSGDYNALFDKAESIADYKAMRAAQAAARADGRLVGVGIAGSIEASGPAPSRVAVSLGSAVGLYETGKVRVHPTGKISVFTGSHSHGQGHETTFAQVVADELGVALEDVEIVHGDTASIPFGLGTYGSRSAAVGGSALVKSAEKIREKVKKIVAFQLEAAEEDLVYDQDTGRIHVKGTDAESPETSRAFGEIAFAAYVGAQIPEGMEPGLEETSFFDPENFTFPNSAHIAQVEIDRDTGEVTLQRYVAVDDVGNVINPLVVDGQIVGGVAQGVGQALLEYGQYNDDGQLLSGSMLDYAVPRAELFPAIETGRTETPSQFNPLGVKGAGEMGTIAATAAVANAVHDALAPLGVRHIDMPLTSEKVWQAIQSASNGG